MLEQHRAKTSTLVVVTHDEGHLGLVELGLGTGRHALRRSRGSFSWRFLTTVVAGDRN